MKFACDVCIKSHGLDATNCIHDCHGPFPKLFYDLMQELEKLDASPQQTKCVIELSKLREKVLRELVYGCRDVVGEYIPEGDLFWDYDDGEMSQPDPDDFLDEIGEYTIMHFNQARSLGDFYGFSTIEEDTGAMVCHYYRNKEDAENAVFRIKKAVEEAKRDND